MWMTARIEITVDRTDPVIKLEGPSPGSVIRGEAVYFRYEVIDDYGLKTIRYRFDDEDWNVTGKEASLMRMLGEGKHLFSVEGFDMAGQSSEISIPFEVSNDYLVEIISPLNGSRISSNKCILNWRYSGNFRWTSALLRIGLKNDFVSIGGEYSYEMTFTEDGEYQITLELVDDLGNFIKNEIYVIKDTKDPRIRFLGIKDGEYLKYGNFSLEWRVLDDEEIGSYHFSIDDGEWKDLGTDNSMDLDLEEGDHNISVRAVDLAGNMGVEEIRVIVDTTAPRLSFVDMESEIQTRTNIIVKWECEDNFGLRGITLAVEGKESIDVLGEDQYLVILPRDGYYDVTITASDLAGNTASDTMLIIVDTTGPTVSWSGDITSPTNLEIIPIGWRSHDDTGIKEVILLEDDVVIWSGSGGGQNGTYLTPDEGNHSYILSAVDISGKTAMIERYIIVDRTAPVIDRFDPSIQKGILNVEWSVRDELTSVKSVILWVEGDLFTSYESNGSWRVIGLEPGQHTVHIEVRDEAGNSIKKNMNVIIDDLSVQNDDDKDITWGVMILLIFSTISVIILLSAIIFPFVYRNRKSDKSYDSPEDRNPIEIVKLQRGQEGGLNKDRFGFKPAPGFDPAFINNTSAKGETNKTDDRSKKV
ncbi:MAG: hypothetical protein ACMUIG_04510 [Thermoplasmatota archaeon]